MDDLNKWSEEFQEEHYTGRVSSEEMEAYTNEMMDQVLEALNTGDKEKFLSLFSEPVRNAHPDLEAMADEVFTMYRGTGMIVDNSNFGSEGHNDHGKHSNFGSNLYEVRTDVADYTITIGNYVTNAFDRSMEGLFVLQISENGYATGKLHRVGKECDGGVFIYHCNTVEELEDLPHQIISEEKMINTSDLPEKRRETKQIVKEDAGVNEVFTFPYIDYYDEEPVSYNWEFETSDGMYHCYRFDPETMELIAQESYAVTHPEYID